jgi:hypothetical protein
MKALLLSVSFFLEAPRQGDYKSYALWGQASEPQFNFNRNNHQFNGENEGPRTGRGRRIMRRLEADVGPDSDVCLDMVWVQGV